MLPGRARGRGPEALVPIENSIEGSVNQTLDHLAAADGGLRIRAEVVHPVRHHLIARADVAPGDLAACSRTRATAQCQEFLRARCPGGDRRGQLDGRCGADGERLGRAVGRDRHAARRRPLRLPVAPDIADTEGNSTRFVLLGTEPAPAVGPGASASIICALERDRPGALLAILQEFAMRAVNLSKLESRPAKAGLGRYIFFIDIEGGRELTCPSTPPHHGDRGAGVARVSFLGSYPADAGSG